MSVIFMLKGFVGGIVIAADGSGKNDELASRVLGNPYDKNSFVQTKMKGFIEKSCTSLGFNSQRVIDGFNDGIIVDAMGEYLEEVLPAFLENAEFVAEGVVTDAGAEALNGLICEFFDGTIVEADQGEKGAYELSRETGNPSDMGKFVKQTRKGALAENCFTFAFRSERFKEQFLADFKTCFLAFLLDENRVVTCLLVAEGETLVCPTDGSKKEEVVEDPKDGDAAVEDPKDGDAAVEDSKGDAAVEDSKGDAAAETVKDEAAAETVKGDAAVETVKDEAAAETVKGDAAVETVKGDAAVETVKDVAQVVKRKVGRPKKTNT